MKPLLVRLRLTHKEFYRLTPAEVIELADSWKIEQGIVDRQETTTYKEPETNEEEIEARLQCDRMAGTLRSMCKPKEELCK